MGFKANPTQIAKVLKGIDYPKSKEELVDYAKEHCEEGDQEVIQILQSLPEREYENMADLEQGVGQVE